MTTTAFPAEVLRLANRNLTREEVLADMRLVVSQFETAGEAIRKLADVPVSTFHNVKDGRQAITTGLLFALYGEAPGNELRVMGPNGRYIRRGDKPAVIARGEPGPVTELPPADDAAFAAIDAARAELAAVAAVTPTADVDAATIGEVIAPTGRLAPFVSDADAEVAAPPAAAAIVADAMMSPEVTPPPPADGADDLEPARRLIRQQRDAWRAQAHDLEAKAARLDDALAVLAA